jgi:anaerobic selenocysteine-containing dehydrogenase
MAGVSRRTLLKGGVAGLSSVVLGPEFFWKCPAAEAAKGRAHVSLYSGRMIQGTPTTCGLCPAGCGMLAFVDEGRLVGLTGNPEHPYNRGALCVFGSSASQLVDGHGRIRKPLRRVGGRGEGRWEELSRKEALGMFTKLLGDRMGKAEPATHGLAVCVPRRDVTPLVERFLSLFQGGLLAMTDQQEHPVETEDHCALGPGFEGPPDLANADLVLNFGANPLGSIRRLVGSAREWAEGRARGAAWITLDPRLSETATASRTWIPLRAGTDGVLALALAQEIVKNDWVDRSFLETETDADRESLWALLESWTPEKAGALCQVPPDQIRWAAEVFVEADRPIAILGSGVTGRRGGVEDAQAILLLNLLVGNIGRQGGYRPFGRMEWRPHVSFSTGAQVVPVLHGTLFWELETGNRKIGCLLSHHANPAVTDPDARKTVEILLDDSRVPFHLALADHWSETVRLADLVLPASTFFESWGLVRSETAAGPGAAWTGLRQPVCPRGEDVRSLDELLLETAQQLGGDWKEALPFRDVEQYYRLLITRSLSAGAFQEAKTRGFVMAPMRAAGRPAERYPVESVLSRIVPRIAEVAGGKNRKEADATGLKLIVHASPTRGGPELSSSWVEEIDHADPLMVNPMTAQRLGLTDGDRVMLKGPAGSIETRVRLTEGIHPEAVAMAAAFVDRASEARCSGEPGQEEQAAGQERWWENESYGGNARKVVPWPEDPRREAPGWMDTAVTITTIEKKTRG